MEKKNNKFKNGFIIGNLVGILASTVFKKKLQGLGLKIVEKSIEIFVHKNKGPGKGYSGKGNSGNGNGITGNSGNGTNIDKIVKYSIKNGKITSEEISKDIFNKILSDGVPFNYFNLEETDVSHIFVYYHIGNTSYINCYNNRELCINPSDFNLNPECTSVIDKIILSRLVYKSNNNGKEFTEYTTKYIHMFKNQPENIKITYHDILLNFCYTDFKKDQKLKNLLKECFNTHNVVITNIKSNCLENIKLEEYLN